jgi:hypothetical protein
MMGVLMYGHGANLARLDRLDYDFKFDRMIIPGRALARKTEMTV